MNKRQIYVYIVVDDLKDIKDIKAAKNKNEFITLQSKSYDIHYIYLETNNFTKVINRQQKSLFVINDFDSQYIIISYVTEPKIIQNNFTWTSPTQNYKKLSIIHHAFNNQLLERPTTIFHQVVNVVPSDQRFITPYGVFDLLPLNKNNMQVKQKIEPTFYGVMFLDRTLFNFMHPKKFSNYWWFTELFPSNKPKVPKVINNTNIQDETNIIPNIITTGNVRNTNTNTRGQTSIIPNVITTGNVRNTNTNTRGQTNIIPNVITKGNVRNTNTNTRGQTNISSNVITTGNVRNTNTRDQTTSNTRGYQYNNTIINSESEQTFDNSNDSDNVIGYIFIFETQNKMLPLHRRHPPLLTTKPFSSPPPLLTTKPFSSPPPLFTTKPFSSPPPLFTMKPFSSPPSLFGNNPRLLGRPPILSEKPPSLFNLMKSNNMNGGEDTSMLFSLIKLTISSSDDFETIVENNRQPLNGDIGSILEDAIHLSADYDVLVCSYLERTEFLNSFFGQLDVDAPNLSIVHHPQQQTGEVVLFPGGNVKRCVNVLKYNDESFKRHYNYHYQTNDNQDYYVRYVDDNIKLYNDIARNWWFEYVFDQEPYCADGKLVQTYGTCWFHATLNTLFMTEKIQNILVYNWEQMTLQDKQIICGKHFDADQQICDDIPSYCPSDYGGMRKELYKIFYNVFIKKRKLKTSDPLIIENASIQALGKPLRKDLNKREKIYNMGARPSNTLITILQELFEDEQYLEFEDMIGIKFDVKLTRQQLLPEFIILYAKISSANRYRKPLKRIQLRKDNKTFNYVLRAAALAYLYKRKKGGHAVAGLFCDDEYYVFDSNNILLRMDWTRPNHSEYIKILNKEHDDELFYSQAEYAIYVKED